MTQSEILRATILITVAAAWVQACYLIKPRPPNLNVPPIGTPAPTPDPPPNVPLNPSSTVILQPSTQFSTYKQSTERSSTTISQSFSGSLSTDLILNSTSTVVWSDNATLTQTEITTENLSTVLGSWWWSNLVGPPSNDETVVESSDKPEAIFNSSISTSTGTSESNISSEYDSDYVFTLSNLFMTIGPYYSTIALNTSRKITDITTVIFEITKGNLLTATVPENSSILPDATSPISMSSNTGHHHLYYHHSTTNAFTTSSTIPNWWWSNLVGPPSDDETVVERSDKHETMFNSSISTNTGTSESNISYEYNSDYTLTLNNLSTAIDPYYSRIAPNKPDNATIALSESTVETTDEAIVENFSFSTEILSSSATSAFTSISWFYNSLTTNLFVPSEYITDEKDSSTVSFSTPLPYYFYFPATDTVSQQDQTSIEPDDEAPDSECPSIKFKKPSVDCKDRSSCKSSDDCKEGFLCCVTDPCGTKKCYQSPLIQ
ncbi:hypothetical protein FHG87_016212 [Trinorchestia longiramus]|nr:hypothetical protein FHG87_016212 [Trinorchestia longiramus]